MISFRVCVLVNRLAEVGPRQTTTLLIGSLLQRGHSVWVAEVDGLGLTEVTARSAQARLPVALVANAVPLSINTASVDGDPWNRNQAIVAQLRATQTTRLIELGGRDVLWIRTNPGRDLDRQGAHRLSLEMAVVAQNAGLLVVNHPESLARVASKATLFELDPQYRPSGLVSGDVRLILQFVHERNQVVLKPVIGSRGDRVVRLDRSQPDLAHRIQDAVSHGPVVAQAFVASEQPGDVRVVVAGGQVLSRGNAVAAIRRLPADGDFRGNLHAGGSAVPVELSDAMRSAAEYGARYLAGQQIWLGGVDLVGDQIIELNVFSTGGLFDAQRFAGVDFTDQLVAQLEDTVQAHAENI